MLRELVIKNLVLIDEAHVRFESGLTVISGETGAGKTALLTALEWIMGMRVDSTKIRNSDHKAVVQAAFELDPHSPLIRLLEEAGISIEDPLIIQREILPSGKSRALISGELASLQLLQQISPYLVSFISQHSHQLLRSESAHLQLLDQFAETEEMRLAFLASWEEEKETKFSLDLLKKEQETAQVKLQHLQVQLEELKNADLKEGEEESLFEEYQRHIKSGQLLENSELILQLLSESKQAILPALKQVDKLLHPLSLDESLLHLQQAQNSLLEVVNRVGQFQHTLESHPSRLREIDERLSLIDKLKKRYGKNIAEIRQLQEHLEESCRELDSLDQRLEITTIKSSNLEKKTKELVALIRDKRKQAANQLAYSLSNSLRALNIPHAEVEIRLEPISRNQNGEDRAQFYLKANPGEKAIAVNESSSGGELARLFLALTVLLAERNQPSTMVFDEIDANVGGITATLIGQQLKELGRYRQVICITHFPQVAQQADQHLRISKREEGGRTLAMVDVLNAKGREEELTRMRG